MQTFAVQFLSILRLLALDSCLRLDCLVHGSDDIWIFFFTLMYTFAHVWISPVYSFTAIVILFLRLICSIIMLCFRIEELVLALLTIFTGSNTVGLKRWCILSTDLFWSSHHFNITMGHFTIVLWKGCIFYLGQLRIRSRRHVLWVYIYFLNLVVEWV